MRQIELKNGFSVSEFIWGHWRLGDWKMDVEGLYRASKEALDLGLNTFDHADIYGDYSCESLFGQVLKAHPELRQDIKLISKCGIKLISEKFPDRKTKYYDYSPEHIRSSVENSLVNLNTDHLDLLLLHRPSPFFDAEQTAAALKALQREGKVKHFGVSNFLPIQFEHLNREMDNNLITNQIELSPFNLEHFENQNLEYLQSKKVKPMAWSPLGGGSLFNDFDTKTQRIVSAIEATYAFKNGFSKDLIIYAWLKKHPSGIIPVLGTGKIERLKQASIVDQIELSLEEWFSIYEAGLGNEVP